jgi:hypothetical protein
LLGAGILWNLSVAFATKRVAIFHFPYLAERGEYTMNKMITNSMKAGALALVLVAASGCQTKQIDEAKAAAAKAQQDAAAAQSTANQALSTANSAASSAAAAKSAADNAQSTANQALQAAQTAQSGVDATNQKLDRMFKQSVSK